MADLQSCLQIRKSNSGYQVSIYFIHLIKKHYFFQQRNFICQVLFQLQKSEQLPLPSLVDLKTKNYSKRVCTARCRNRKIEKSLLYVWERKKGFFGAKPIKWLVEMKRSLPGGWIDLWFDSCHKELPNLSMWKGTGITLLWILLSYFEIGSSDVNSSTLVILFVLVGLWLILIDTFKLWVPIWSARVGTEISKYIVVFSCQSSMPVPPLRVQQKLPRLEGRRGTGPLAP